jgi:MFS-type transporter involved in bile tolerance (Atg22 family)
MFVISFIFLQFLRTTTHFTKIGHFLKKNKKIIFFLLAITLAIFICTSYSVSAEEVMKPIAKTIEKKKEPYNG